MVKWTIPFVGGILLEHYLPTSSVMLPIVVCVACCILLAFSTYSPATNKVIHRAFLPLFIATAISFGYSIAMLNSPLHHSSHYYHFATHATAFEATVADKPAPTAKTIKATVEVDKLLLPHAEQHCKGKAIVYLKKDSLSATLRYGDRLQIRAPLREIAAPQNPCEFDYKRYLERKGILAQAYADNGSYTIVGRDTAKGIMALAYRLRDKMIEIVEHSDLSEVEQGIASAILLGWDENIDAQTLQNFSGAGISHILCVSGLHLGIISMMVGYCLFFLGNSRTHRAIKGCIKLAVLWFFAMATGLAPSAMRAAIMFSLITIGQMLYTRNNVYNNIATSAFFLLLADSNLIFDVGFLLSYSAVTGIVSLHPWLSGLIVFPNTKAMPTAESASPIPRAMCAVAVVAHNAAIAVSRKVYSLACVSVAAQLFVSPFVLYFFHQFPTYFLLANIVVVPFAGLLLGAALLAVLLSWLPVASLSAQWLFSTLAQGANAVAAFVANLPHATISNIYFDTFMLVAAIVAVLCLALGIRRQWKPYLYTAATAIAAVAAYATYSSAAANLQQKWVVYSTPKHTTIEIFDGKTSYLIADSVLIADTKTMKYAAHNYRINNHIDHTTTIPLHHDFENTTLYKNDMFVAFGNQRIGIVTKNHHRRYTQKLDLTHLIVDGNPYTTVEELCMLFDFDTLIISANNSIYRATALQQQCYDLGIPCHNIPLQGAFVGCGCARTTDNRRWLRFAAPNNKSMASPVNKSTRQRDY